MTEDKKKLLKLRDEYVKGDAAKRDSIINLPIVQKNLEKGKKFKKGVDKRKISCYPIIPFGGVNI